MLRRGAIFDRDGNLLALSQDQDGQTVRRYFIPTTYSAVGYSSRIHGSGGFEAELDAFLRGQSHERTPEAEIIRRLFQIPQQGIDVRVTLAVPVQDALYDLLNGRQGAAVVISIPDGGILGLVSAPQYDPNEIDSQWASYRSDRAEPLINRAIQRLYPPGSLAQTPLLAAGLLLNVDVEAPAPASTETVTFAGNPIGCVVPLPALELTLSEAYLFGCPAPFLDLGERIGPTTVQAVLDSFMLLEPPELLSALRVISQTEAVEENQVFDLRAEVLGQGQGRLTPLTAALIAAALANDGNAPFPHILEAVRPSGSDEWQGAVPLHPSLPITTVDTARRMSDLLRRAVAQGAAQNAGRPEIDIGGQVGLARYAGRPLSWFIGFATLGRGQGLAVAVVLEDVDDVGIAADIGGSALVSAREYVQGRSTTAP
ncbi:MAG: penicillin-binding transpeptidase domain-containing protein [Candidatus Flexifilum sp.]